MKFTTLGQTGYVNDNGVATDPDEVEFLAPYKHVVDGFYTWECGNCSQSHGSRSCGWPISGQVIACESCKKKNLLVRTNTNEISEALALAFRREEVEIDLARKRAESEKYIPVAELEDLRKASEGFMESHRKMQLMADEVSRILSRTLGMKGK